MIKLKFQIIIALILFPSISFCQLTYDLKFEDLSDYYATGARSMTYVKQHMIRDSLNFNSRSQDGLDVMFKYKIDLKNEQEKANVIYGKNSRFEIIDRVRFYDSRPNHDSLIFHYSKNVPFDLPSKIEYFKPIMNGNYLRVELVQVYFKKQDSLISILVDTYRGGDTLKIDQYIVNDNAKLVRSQKWGHLFLNYYYSEQDDLNSVEGYTTRLDSSFIKTLVYYYSDRKTERTETNFEFINTTTYFDGENNIVKIVDLRYENRQALQFTETYYEYDMKGNWIKKIEISNNNDGFVTTRKIEY